MNTCPVCNNKLTQIEYDGVLYDSTECIACGAFVHVGYYRIYKPYKNVTFIFETMHNITDIYVRITISGKPIQYLTTIDEPITLHNKQIS